MQKSRFYLAKPTLLECETIGFGTPKRSYWLSACYVRCAKVVICNDFFAVLSSAFFVRLQGRGHTMTKQQEYAER